MKSFALLALLVFGGTAYSASVSDIPLEDRLTDPESYLSHSVSQRGHEFKIEIRNSSKEDVIYTSDLPGHFRLIEEEYLEGKWSIVMSGLCGGVVNDWKLKPGEILSLTTTAPQQTSPRKFYFPFAVAGSSKKGIIEIKIKKE